MIRKLEISISHTIVKNLCVSYRGIQTGLTLFLFHIHNIIMNNNTRFDINAYSFCDIDKRLKFYIYFEKSKAKCIFNNVKNFNVNNSNNLIASCTLDGIYNDLNEYYFPKAYSKNNISINIYNYRKYLTIIFNNFYCEKKNICILNTFFYQNASKGYNIEISINDTQYICKLKEDVIYLNNIFPVMKDFKCESNPKSASKKIYVSGLPSKFWIPPLNKSNISNIFIVSRIANDIFYKKIFIIGRLYDNLEINLNYFSIELVYPKITLICSLPSISKYAQAHIYCHANINSNILMENQIIYTKNHSFKLLLINEETFLIKDKIINLNLKSDKHNESIFLVLYLNYTGLLVIIIIKCYKLMRKSKEN